MSPQVPATGRPMEGTPNYYGSYFRIDLILHGLFAVFFSKPQGSRAGQTQILIPEPPASHGGHIRHTIVWGPDFPNGLKPVPRGAFNIDGLDNNSDFDPAIHLSDVGVIIPGRQPNQTATPYATIALPLPIAVTPGKLDTIPASRYCGVDAQFLKGDECGNRQMAYSIVLSFLLRAGKNFIWPEGTMGKQNLHVVNEPVLDFIAAPISSGLDAIHAHERLAFDRMNSLMSGVDLSLCAPAWEDPVFSTGSDYAPEQLGRLTPAPDLSRFEPDPPNSAGSPALARLIGAMVRRKSSGKQCEGRGNITRAYPCEGPAIFY